MQMVPVLLGVIIAILCPFLLVVAGAAGLYFVFFLLIVLAIYEIYQFVAKAHNAGKKIAKNNQEKKRIAEMSAEAQFYAATRDFFDKKRTITTNIRQ